MMLTQLLNQCGFCLMSTPSVAIAHPAGPAGFALGRADHKTAYVLHHSRAEPSVVPIPPLTRAMTEPALAAGTGASTVVWGSSLSPSQGPEMVAYSQRLDKVTSKCTHKVNKLKC